MPPFEQALYYSAAPTTYTPCLLLFAACHSHVPLLHMHAVILNRLHFPNVLRGALTPLDRSSSFLRSGSRSSCHSALPLLLTVSEAPRSPALGGGFWLQARGPRQQARNNVAHNLQMLACIRAWQLVMSPPPLPHSSITSHLLPDTSWGRWWGMEAGSLWTEAAFRQEEEICHGG